MIDAGAVARLSSRVPIGAPRRVAAPELDPRFRLLGDVPTEDDFDAAVTALALPQRLLDGRPLSDGDLDQVAEGAILLG